MIKRTLYFENPLKLNLRYNQLIVTDKDVGEIGTIPIEDIGVIIFDHPQLIFSTGVIQKLNEEKVAVIFCSPNHMPQSLLLPLEGNTIQQERYETQIKMSEPLKKQLWAQVVASKIKNQAIVFEYLHYDTKYLLKLAENVKSGDSDNVEATSASYYWSKMFPSIENFKRHREGIPPNHWLNYGYAILRAIMARSIVSSGLIPTLGIFHRNRYNAFCLADDLMEPFRPVVDKLVIELVKKHGIKEDISKDVKLEFLKIPVIDVIQDNQKSPLMHATHRLASSFVKCIEGEQRKLLTPELII